VLSGDDVSKLKPEQIATIKKLLPPTGVAAQFEDDSFAVGWATVKGETRVFLLNWSDKPVTRSFTMKHEAELRDFWNGEDFGTKTGSVTVELSPRSARVLTYK
jgi:alpha-galactosidase